ncbi:hypothetical protein ACFWBF_05980 [Streptomyces sp. NPDC060028]|uniref:hypothetical protein n=1 Tax=Streptomyces sp. NPDC060028 TaxID=3347041 RepID=UPI0036BD4010
MAVFKQYTREMHKEFGYFATWAPNTELRLGDVGVIRGHRFDPVTSLAELGVAFPTSTTGPVSTFTYSSAGRVSASMSPEVGLPGLLGVDPTLVLTVTFTRKEATFFRAVRCEAQRIGDLPSVEASIRQLTAAKRWRGEYAVVTELVRTGPAIILVSSSSETSVEVQVTAESVPLPAPLSGAVGLGVGTSASSGLAANVITPQGGLTPLFRAAAMRRVGIGGRRLRVRERPGAADSAARELTSVSWEEFAREPVQHL